jgi:hypothetical protein
VSEADSCRYAGIAGASIRRRRSEWTELDGQTVTELWNRLCQQARLRGTLSDEDARVTCHRLFHYAQLDALRITKGRRPVAPPVAPIPPEGPDPHRQWVADHLHFLTPKQHQVVKLALTGYSMQEIETILGLARGSAQPLMARAERTLKRIQRRGAA